MVLYSAIKQSLSAWVLYCTLFKSRQPPIVPSRCSFICLAYFLTPGLSLRYASYIKCCIPTEYEHDCQEVTTQTCTLIIVLSSTTYTVWHSTVYNYHNSLVFHSSVHQCSYLIWAFSKICKLCAPTIDVDEGAHNFHNGFHARVLKERPTAPFASWNNVSRDSEAKAI